MKTIRVTGATGFAGRHTLKSLMKVDDIKPIATCRDKSKLISALAKVQQDLKCGAKKKFDVFDPRIKKQFQAMGYSNNAAELSMHLMVWPRGTGTMARIHQDSRILQREVKAILNWLESLNALEN